MMELVYSSIDINDNLHVIVKIPNSGFLVLNNANTFLSWIKESIIYILEY